MADAEAKSTPTPQKLSMAFAVGVLARLIPRPREEHWACVKGVLRYWKHIVDYRIIYGSEDATIRGYADADFVADPDRRQSVGGYAYLGRRCCELGLKALAYCGNFIHGGRVYGPWHGAWEALWLRKLIFDGVFEPICVLCDSVGAMAQIHNPVGHQLAKHIDVQHQL
jgi:hypothetical protein